MAEKIRLGNDIGINWSLIDEEGNPYNLEGRDVSVEIDVGEKKRYRIKELSVSGNTVSFVYWGKDQKYTGRCDLKFIENDGEKEMVTFDTKGAFELVAHSWLIGGEPETERVQLSFVTVTSELTERVGPKGDPGVGIESVEQTKTSTEDEGVNEITVTLTDGTSTIFEVRNGSKGPKGETGDTGPQGEQGIQGPKGEDAEVTAEAIENALGYKPANEAELGEKQDVITDLSEIRSGAAKGNTAYQKPATGIPAADLSSSVQQALSIIQRGTGSGSVRSILGNGSSEPSATGKNAVAFGSGTQATGAGAFAEGNATVASGKSAHAEGNSTKAVGDRSHAEGEQTQTTNYAEHAEGRFNKSNSASTTFGDAGNTQHSVGIGSSDSDRKNAFEIMQNGDAYLFGVGGYDGTNPTSGANDLATIISGFGGSALEKITWSDLKSKRDNSQLTPGQYYEITDYTCTTVQENTQAAGHDFDVVVLALATNKLSEEALATQHEGDTYFAASKLEAWKLWYCLDNDTTRFAWADSENGKGVIYRMIDEWGNDCPYDFKNIQFKRKITLDSGYPELDLDQGVDTWVFTFAATSHHISNDSWSELKDGSLESPYGHESDERTSTFHDNVIGKYIKIYDGDEDYTKCGKQYLNDNVFFGYWEEVGSDDPENTPYYYARCSYGFRFGINCYGNTFGNDCSSNTFGNDCSSNTFGYKCSYNTFGNDCNSNTFGNNCSSNTFGNDCNSNTFGKSCCSNTFGNNCSSNTFGKSCCSNTFGNNCSSNTFGNDCDSNTFGNYCHTIKFGRSSTVKSYCSNNIVENGNQFIRINATGTTSIKSPYRNVKIAQGVNNTNTFKTITDSNVGQTFQTVYQPENSQTINV